MSMAMSNQYLIINKSDLDSLIQPELLVLVRRLSLEAQIPYIRMRHADTAAICGCLKRYTSRTSPYIAESSAFRYNFDSAARWEHCRIPLLLHNSIHVLQPAISKAPYLRISS